MKKLFLFLFLYTSSTFAQELCEIPQQWHIFKYLVNTSLGSMQELKQSFDRIKYKRPTALSKKPRRTCQCERRRMEDIVFLAVTLYGTMIPVYDYIAQCDKYEDLKSAIGQCLEIKESLERENLD
jgi:hypothetical protein